MQKMHWVGENSWVNFEQTTFLITHTRVKDKTNKTQKESCTTCNHKHYKNYSGCPSCNCGESERVYTGGWRGFDPEAMYHGYGGSSDPYERSARELNVSDDNYDSF